jgi:hypothetical protein
VVDPQVSRRTYSGTMNGNTDSMMDSPSQRDATNAWIADKSSSDAWMRIDLGSLMEVKGVVLAGRKTKAEFATKVGHHLKSCARSMLHPCDIVWNKPSGFFGQKP